MPPSPRSSIANLESRWTVPNQPSPPSVSWRHFSFTARGSGALLLCSELLTIFRAQCHQAQKSQTPRGGGVSVLWEGHSSVGSLLLLGMKNRGHLKCDVLFQVK